MRLQDSIAASQEPLLVELDGKGLFTLPSATSIAAGVRTAPLRYILDDTVAAIAARAAFSDPERLLNCLELVRMPASRIWVEWSERGRKLVLAELALLDPIEAARTEGRAGLLVRSDEGGRRGEISIAWDGDAPEPDLSPLLLRFDLDDPAYALQARSGVLTRGLTISNSEGISRILRHVRFELDHSWRDYYKAACATPASLEDALRQCLTMVAGDFPFLLAFCLLLTARNAVAFAPISLERLNASRAKGGKFPLLDHIEVKARLGGERPIRRLETGLRRSESRLHFVSGHFVRRGTNVFWRRSHLRGNAMRGVISARTVVVLPNAALH